MSLLRSRAPAAELHAIRFSLRAPPDGLAAFAFSPDGSQIAFLSAGKIWLRPLSAPEARAMAGTDGADSGFWSPDGRSIGFFTANKLWRVDLSGGAPVPICDVPDAAGYAGTWGAGGQMLFAGMRGDAIYRVSTSGGKPVAIVKADRARGETRVRWPWFLPDGKSFLYHSSREGASGSLMFSPPEGPARPLFSMLSRVEYVDPGYLVFVKDGTLLAQRFDTRSGMVSGEPFSIADSVGYYLSYGERGLLDLSQRRARVSNPRHRPPAPHGLARSGRSAGRDPDADGRNRRRRASIPTAAGSSSRARSRRPAPTTSGSWISSGTSRLA